MKLNVFLFNNQMLVNVFGIKETKIQKTLSVK